MSCWLDNCFGAIGPEFAKFGIWSGSKLVGTSGRDIVCAGCAVYGPRTTAYIASKGVNHVQEFSLCSGRRGDAGVSSQWFATRCISEIKPGKLFAPANMRAAQDHPGYAKLLDTYMGSRYTLRYTGGMVPDVTQLLVKGKGVFASPASSAAPAKLRLLYEALPMAFLIENGGGKSSDGSRSILDRVVKACDERTPICLGSSDEVARYEKHCPFETKYE